MALAPNPQPDPDTRKPAYRLPAGACDCHAHIFGPRDKYPLLAEPGYLPADAPEPAYLKMLRTVGVERAVLIQPSPYGTDNSAMAAALRSHDFPFRGIALIDDATTDRQLEQLHWLGVQGVRLHVMPDNAEAVLASLPRLVQRIRPYGWHLQFYLNAERMPEIDRTLADLPCKVVIDHFGLVPASAGARSKGLQTLVRLARAGNAWFKLSAPYRVSELAPRYPDVAPLAHALLEAAPDRCLWGTDWPHPNSKFIPNDGDLVDLIPDWIPDLALRRRVLVENPAQLYGF